MQLGIDDGAKNVVGGLVWLCYLIFASAQTSQNSTFQSWISIPVRIPLLMRCTTAEGDVFPRQEQVSIVSSLFSMRLEKPALSMQLVETRVREMTGAHSTSRRMTSVELFQGEIVTRMFPFLIAWTEGRISLLAHRSAGSLPE